MKPAPVQVSWLGYPDTTGLSAMDYRFTDDLADPPGVSDQLAVETLIRLPDGFLCYQPPADTPDVRPLPALEQGRVTFGSFNFLAKTNDRVLALWAELLCAIPTARLVLKSPPLADTETGERVLHGLAAAGVAPERVECRPATATYAEHLATYHDIDIALDTFPYTGTTTIFEALWMGVPVITLAGDRHVSRVGMSILSRLGLTGCIARDQDGYLRAAEELAADLPRLSALRLQLRERVRNSPFADSRRFVAQLEREFRRVWHAHCAAANGSNHGTGT
jgi:predicted O-linked N-acetylglucosamine transferase (SPINDLY family)